MAFGKKKDETAEALAGMPPAEPQPESEAADDLTGAFAAPAEEAAPADAVAQAPAEAVAPAADPLGSPDALLNMFQESQVEGDDNTVLLDLAGEVQIADLLEDLHTLVAAMGITVARAA